jgi:hypothetical protein
VNSEIAIVDTEIAVMDSEIGVHAGDVEDRVSSGSGSRARR